MVSVSNAFHDSVRPRESGDPERPTRIRAIGPGFPLSRGRTGKGRGQGQKKEGTRSMPKAALSIAFSLAFAGVTVAHVDGAKAQSCTTMRKINVGVSSAPPNVVHTSPYVAKDLGFFAKYCIDANIVQFE